MNLLINFCIFVDTRKNNGNFTKTPVRTEDRNKSHQDELNQSYFLLNK